MQGIHMVSPLYAPESDPSMDVESLNPFQQSLQV